MSAFPGEGEGQGAHSAAAQELGEMTVKRPPGPPDVFEDSSERVPVFRSLWKGKHGPRAGTVLGISSS